MAHTKGHTVWNIYNGHEARFAEAAYAVKSSQPYNSGNVNSMILRLNWHLSAEEVLHDEWGEPHCVISVL